MAKTAKITAILVVVLVLSLVVFTACDGSLRDEIDKLKQEIDNLQQQVGGYEADFEEKQVVIYIGEKRFDVTTRKAYLHDVIKDLFEEGKICAYEYGNDDLNPFISAIDVIEQNYAEGKYYSVWHNVDNFSLKGLDSSWGNPSRATIEADEYGNRFVVTQIDGVTLNYSAVGVGILPLVDGCTYAIMVD
jgi:membrane protein implicated in regulation of membrane protease activity